MRRLQDLVDRATGLDASEEDEDDLALPSTMQTKKSADRHHDKKKQKKEKEKEKKSKASSKSEGATAGAAEAPAEAPTSSSAVAGGSADKPKKSKAQDPSVKEGSIGGGDAGRTAVISSSSPTADEWEEVEDEDEDGLARGRGGQRTSGTRGGAAKEGTAQHKKKAAQEEDEAVQAAAAAAATEEEKRRKKEERRKLRQQQQRQKQAEEEALLDAVLAHQADTQAAGDGTGRANSSSAPSSPNAATGDRTHNNNNNSVEGGAPASEFAGSLQHFVMACDAQQLDTRLERIRMFGAGAVEDVGDGRTPHRRADGRVRDTGSVSFFPAHHLHVKFVHSAFATPNRYRWVPYDSLGVYLTTTEAHGAHGRETWREYTLNCDSNAFQRALAQLGACQDRMGGVQDLVECLARNKVYHIPTLLQCVYAMEATGESAFAGELLDVALYQVGVILRRFTLSGTWSQRRLPMQRGGNALLFQTLQRGVHAALKRGCLRTAFERTRCVLSLDERDPCGMLLLLDYTALRAKRWVWLLELRHRVRTSSGAPLDHSLERSIKALPNFAFSWALAKHFIEREERLQSTQSGPNAVGGGGDRKPSKVLRGMTESQREALAATPSAEELLRYAVTHFPHAAVRLVNALGGVETVCGGSSSSDNTADDLPVSDASAWFGGVVAQAEDEASEGAAQQNRLADLFVARHEELWKLNECISLLRSVVYALLCEPAVSAGEQKDSHGALEDGGARQYANAPASPLTCSSPLLDPYAYLDLTQEAVMGVSVAAIPADLLRPDAADFAMGVDGGVGGDPAMIDDATAQQLLDFLRQHRENAVGADADTQEYLQMLEQQLVERVRNGDGGEGADGQNNGDGRGGRARVQAGNNNNNNNRHAARNPRREGGEEGSEGGADSVEWYDYDDEEAGELEGQEWYSVASSEGHASDAEEEGQSYPDPE